MLRTHPKTQHHNPADWNIFYMRFLLAKNINIPCLGSEGVQFERHRCLMGGNHLHLHGQAWYTPSHPSRMLFQPYLLPVLFNACFILVMVPLCMPAVVTLLHGFTCFCTQCWDSFIINMCPCIFFFHLFELHFFIVNAQFIFQFTSKSLTYGNFMRLLS